MLAVEPALKQGGSQIGHVLLRLAAHDGGVQEPGWVGQPFENGAHPLARQPGGHVVELALQCQARQQPEHRWRERVAVEPARNLDVFKVLRDARGQFGQRGMQPEPHADACGVGGQAQHEELHVALADGQLPRLQRFEQGLNRPDAAIGIVLAFAEDVGKGEFAVEAGSPVRPEHGGGIADLHAVARAGGEQAIQCGGVGKCRTLADRCVFSLAFRLAVGLESPSIERHDVRAGALSTPNPFD